MVKTNISRRALLTRGMQIPVGGAVLFGLSACGGSGSAPQQASAACGNSSLSDGETAMRGSVHYTDNSPNPQQACGGCAFFHMSEAQGGCAQCDILHGQVSEKGHCDSWSARA